MGTDLPLLGFPILVLASAQFRMQELLWGQTAACAEVKPPPVLFTHHYPLLQLATAVSLLSSQLHLGGF